MVVISKGIFLVIIETKHEKNEAHHNIRKSNDSLNAKYNQIHKSLYECAENPLFHVFICSVLQTLLCVPLAAARSSPLQHIQVSAFGNL